MADRSGKLFHEVMGWPGPVTYRQYLAWEAWTLLDFDTPSRSDYYLMQMCLHIDAPNVKDAKGLKLSDYRLRTGTESRARKLSLEEASAISKAMWAVRLGIDIPMDTKD